MSMYKYRPDCVYMYVCLYVCMSASIGSIHGFSYNIPVLNQQYVYIGLCLKPIHPISAIYFLSFYNSSTHNLIVNYINLYC